VAAEGDEEKWNHEEWDNLFEREEERCPICGGNPGKRLIKLFVRTEQPEDERARPRLDKTGAITDPLQHIPAGTALPDLCDFRKDMIAQIDRLDLSLRAAARIIIDALDERGWLNRELQDLARPNCTLKALEQAHEAIKAIFDLPAVAARDLRELWLVQLDREIHERSVGARSDRPDLAYAILQDDECWLYLQRGYLAAIQKKLGRSSKEIQDAKQELRRLPRYPAACYEQQPAEDQGEVPEEPDHDLPDQGDDGSPSCQ
jgi:hypothetical protein